MTGTHKSVPAIDYRIPLSETDVPFLGEAELAA